MKKNNSIAVFGGTFNPIHNAHVHMINAFLNEYKVDLLLITPTGIPPHKEFNQEITNKQRLYMCELVAKKFKNVKVCDLELKRQGKSFTVDTLEEIKKIYSNPKIHFLMGADMFKSFKTWKNPEKILKLASLCVIPRNDKNLDNLLKIKNMLLSFYPWAKINVLQTKQINISSSKIRKIIKNRGSLQGLLPEDIIEYLDKHNLYKGADVENI